MTFLFHVPIKTIRKNHAKRGGVTPSSSYVTCAAALCQSCASDQPFSRRHVSPLCFRQQWRHCGGQRARHPRGGGCHGDDSLARTCGRRQATAGQRGERHRADILAVARRPAVGPGSWRIAFRRWRARLQRNLTRRGSGAERKRGARVTDMTAAGWKKKRKEEAHFCGFSFEGSRPALNQSV